eukprot:6438039-Alexandrium_andersonii.AAC.1
MVALSLTPPQKTSILVRPKSTSMKTWAPSLWARKVVGPSTSAMSLVDHMGSSLDDQTRRPTGWLMVAGVARGMRTK